ncbi:zinc permease, partial [Mycobacterium sp. ITM-2017-0098]
GLALLAAVTLDGVPENLALGVSLVGGASISLLVAIFFSNLPESLVSAVAMREAGTRTRTIMLTWIACAALLAAAVVLGRITAGALSEHVLAI